MTTDWLTTVQVKDEWKILGREREVERGEEDGTAISTFSRAEGEGSLGS